MVGLRILDKESFVDEFLEKFLSRGMGSHSKRETDILLMHLFTKYGNIADLSNHQLSILLQTTETRIKGWLYEAKLKYPPEEKYIQTQFLCILNKAQFEIEKGDHVDLNRIKIIFAIEDNYLRYAIQGRLKEKGMFADSSFNREIVKIDFGSLSNVIEELYDAEIAENFQRFIIDILKSDSENAGERIKEGVGKFILETATSVLSGVALASVKSACGLP